MTTAASGEARATRAAGEVQELRRQAAELLARAERLERFQHAVEKGNAGEHHVGALLDVLRSEGWYVLHDRRKSRRSPANLDHVAVGPPGVVVVDAKNWSGGRLRLDERGMALGGYRKDDELRAARADADLVAGHVPPATPVRAALAFVQDVGLSAPQHHHGVTALQAADLQSWLRGLPVLLDPREVWRLGERLDGALPPRTAPLPRRVPARRARPDSRAGARPRVRGRRRRWLVPLAGVVAGLLLLDSAAALGELASEHLAPLLSDALTREPTAPEPPVPPAAVPVPVPPPS